MTLSGWSSVMQGVVWCGAKVWREQREKGRQGHGGSGSHVQAAASEAPQVFRAIELVAGARDPLTWTSLGGHAMDMSMDKEGPHPGNL